MSKLGWPADSNAVAAIEVPHAEQPTRRSRRRARGKRKAAYTRGDDLARGWTQQCLQLLSEIEHVDTIP